MLTYILDIFFSTKKHFSQYVFLSFKVIVHDLATFSLQNIIKRHSSSATSHFFFFFNNKNHPKFSNHNIELALLILMVSMMTTVLITIAHILSLVSEMSHV